MKQSELKMKIIKQPICKYCGSTQIYFTEDKIKCRRCGHEQTR